ncbi:MAG: peptide chain release factor N(5)-glutamine methyltransferase [Syntrophomonadaceae bacterium]|nr:peptide chain release factor N(5)-glutamine methyltransferase [Syntrophomonadaceae bacterium]
MQDAWSIIDILEWTTRYFKSKGITEPRLEAEILMSFVLKKDRVYLYAHFDAPVSPQERKALRENILRRVNGEPSAYITGNKEFMSLNFYVTPAVLIPRTDTEVLVEKVIELAGERKNLNICDVGTGSGIIAVSLACYIKDATIFAADISPAAAEITRRNAERHSADINILTGDLLEPVKDEKFDFITANLPYINPARYDLLEREIKEYEPQSALLAAGDGLEIYRRLMPQAYRCLQPDGYLLFEIGYDQGQAALKITREFADSCIIKDYGGRDRVIVARKEEKIAD